MPYRDLSVTELDLLLEKGLCPFCGGDEFYEGPHGGRMINWYCANERCFAGFNLTPPVFGLGHLIRESYITTSAQGDRMPEAQLRALFKQRTTLKAWLEMLKSTRFTRGA